MNDKANIVSLLLVALILTVFLCKYPSESTSAFRPNSLVEQFYVDISEYISEIPKIAPDLDLPLKNEEIPKSKPKEIKPRTKLVPVTPVGKIVYVRPSAHSFTFKKGSFIDSGQNFGLWLKCTIMAVEGDFYFVQNLQPDLPLGNIYIVKKTDVVEKK